MNAYPATTSFSYCAFHIISTDHSSHSPQFKLTVNFSCRNNYFAFASSPFSSSKCIQPRSRRAASAVNVIKTAPAQQSSSETPPAELNPRRLILLRHAESSWDDTSLRDHDRPLSNAGQVDAAKVSQKLDLLGWIPELILSSDARRTKETLKIMQNEVPGFLNAEIHFLSSFYSVAAMDGQTAEHLRRSICEYSTPEIITIMCMGHNRGWEEAATVFSGVSVELKTCNAALLEANGESWEEESSVVIGEKRSRLAGLLYEAFSLAGFGGWRLHAVVQP